MQLKPLATVACLALALAGCATPAPPPSAGPAEDMTGAARACTVSQVALTPGRETTGTMQVGNDGGWCAVRVTQPNGGPFATELLVGPPANGRVFYHTVNNLTRVEYTPNPGFHGSDAFTVRFVPGDSTLRMTVTVQ